MSHFLNQADIDQLPCGIIEVSSDRRIVVCNQFVSQTLSKAKSTILGKKLESIVSAATKIFIDSYVYPLIIHDKVAHEVQLMLKNSDCKSIPIVTNITLKNDGTSIWSFIVCENRNKLYDELLSTRDLLSRQASELKLLNENIQRDNDKMEVFCRSLSHDFTGPIRQSQQAISFVMEDLTSKALDVNSEISILCEVDHRMNMLLQLIGGLLEYLTADGGDQVNEVVDLNRVISDVLHLVESQAKIPVQIETEGLPKIEGNDAQLKIIFKNIIGNAIKYNQNVPKISITCDSTSRVDHNIIAIKDNGIGISPEYVDKIFEPFKRLHGQGIYSGSGLGLSIVQKLIHKNHGDIFLKSTPGEGSTFYITFPALRSGESFETEFKSAD